MGLATGHSHSTGLTGLKRDPADPSTPRIGGYTPSGLDLHHTLVQRHFATYKKSMSDNFHEELETFENQFPNRDYVIETICPEFTSVCPKTGQPDFGELTITYVPDRLCIELKSLKMYLQRFRNHGVFYEHITNRILDDLTAACKPRRMKIHATFTPRGGIRTNITAEHVAQSPTHPTQ